MKILSIVVGGFKNLKKTKIDFNDITVLLSPNNYGKSNLMEAIDFGVDFIHESRKNRKTMMNWTKGIPICPELQNEEYFFEIEFEDEELENIEYKYIKYGFSFIWHRDDNTGERITNEWIETRPNTSVRYTAFLRRDENKYRKSKTTSSFRKVELDNLQLAIDAIVLIEDAEISCVCKAINELSFRVCTSLDLGDRYQPSPIEYADDEGDVLRFDDEDIPKALHILKTKDPNNYELFVEAVLSLFPEFSALSLNEYSINSSNLEDSVSVITSNNSEIIDVKDLPFRIKEHIYRLFVKSEYLNQPVSISNMSTGTKRVIWLLANAFISNHIGASIIGIEELETSIHPRLIKQLLEVLTDAVEHTPIIISSHSPYLAQYLKAEKIYIGIPNDKGIAKFQRFQSSKIKSLINSARDNGLSVGEYIFELLSGDSDSYSILNSYLEES